MNCASFSSTNFGSLSNPVDEEITSPIFRRRFLVPSHSQAT